MANGKKAAGSTAGGPEKVKRPFPVERHVGGVKGVRKTPQVLKDMRLAYGTPAPAEGGGEEAGESQGLRMFRKMFRENPNQFVREFRAAEKEWAAGAKKAEPVAEKEKEEKPKEAAVADAGGDRVDKLLADRLAAYEAEGLL